MFYSELVNNYFDNPANVGNADNATHTALIGNYQGGAVIKLTAKVKDNIIEDIKFKVYGGVALIASMSLMTDLVKNKTIDYALTVKSHDISEKLKLDSSKYVSAIMAVESLQKLFCST